MFSLGFRHRQASLVLFSDHQASPVVISDFIGSPSFTGDHLSFLSYRISSPGVAGDHLGISDFIGSLSFADDHLGFPSASWLSPSLAVTLSDSLAPQDSVGLGCSSSTAKPRSRHLGCSSCSASSGWLSVPFGTPALCIDLTVGLAPPVGLGCSSSTAKPRRCLSPFGGSRSSQLLLHPHSSLGIMFLPLLLLLSFQIGFDSWLRYYLLFCLICKLGYLLVIYCTILATAWFYWVIWCEQQDIF